MQLKSGSIQINSNPYEDSFFRVAQKIPLLSNYFFQSRAATTVVWVHMLLTAFLRAAMPALSSPVPPEEEAGAAAAAAEAVADVVVGVDTTAEDS